MAAKRVMSRMNELYADPARRSTVRSKAEDEWFTRLCTQIRIQGGGNNVFKTTAAIRRHLLPILETFMISDWDVDFMDSILTVKFEFRADSIADAREDELVEMVRLWGDVLHGASPNRAKIQWIVFTGASIASTPLEWARKGDDEYSEQILALLQTDSGEHVSIDDAISDPEDLPVFELKVIFIPPSEQDGGGKKRKVPDWVLHPEKYHKMVGWKPGEHGQAGKEIHVYEPKQGASKKLKNQGGRHNLAVRKHMPYKDCKTTNDRQDCAARCLAYLFVRQFGVEDVTKKDYRIDYGGVSVSMKQPGNYYGNVGPSASISKASKKLLEYAGLDETHPVDYREMNMFTTANALGLNARIYVFAPTYNGVPELLFKTDDNRFKYDMAADPVLRRQQHEADIRRFNHKSIFEIQESFNERPIQHYCLWLSGQHYYAVENCDVHKLWPSNPMVSQRYIEFCFKHDRPHTLEVSQECGSKATKSSVRPCVDCGTTMCDSAAYVPAVEEKGDDSDDDDYDEIPVDTKYCQECNLHFKTQLCFQRHLEPRTATVGKKKLMDVTKCCLRFRCRFCREVKIGHSKYDKMIHTKQCVKTASQFINLLRCGHCRVDYAAKEDFDEHDCIIRAPSEGTQKKKATRLSNVWYVDFETYVSQEESKEGTASLHTYANIHIVNLVVMISADDPRNVKKFNTIKEFIDFVFDEDYFENKGAGEGSEFAKSTTLIAHNGRGYDWPTLLAAIHKHTKLSYENVTQGTKLMYIMFDNMPRRAPPHVGKFDVDAAEAAENDKESKASKYDAKGRLMYSEVRLIDSLSFIPRPLADFSSMFGLGEEALKGFWPYQFNTPANFGYRGPIPDVEWYEPLGMSEKKFKAFWSWYAEEVYKTDRQPGEHLDKAVQWILDNTSGKQREDAQDFFDSWIRPDPAPDYESDWDFYKMLCDYCVQDVHILRQGFEWFRNYCMNLFPDDELKGFDPARFVSGTGMCLDIWLSKWYRENTFTPLPYKLSEKLRLGFHGGRTEAAILYFNLDAFTRNDRPASFPGNRMLSPRAHAKVKDLRSSYPFQCRERPYPTGDPIIFNSAEEFVMYFAGVPGARSYQWPGANTDGSIIARILADATATAQRIGWQKVFDTKILDLFLDHSPQSLACIELTFEGPEGLRFPVLPANVVVEEKTEDGSIKRTTKLMFDLYKHADQIKTTISLKRAKALGYRFTDVKSIVYWPKNQVKIGLWKEYVDLFYGQKLAAEGWPAGCETEAQQAEHIRYLKNVHNLDIKKEQVKKSAGLYSMSKTLLTSNWGRMVLGSNKANVTVFRAPDQLEDFFTLMKDPRLIIHDVITLNKDTVKVRWSKAEGFERLAPKTNVCVGIFTTEWGRDRLYEGLAQLHPDQVVYMDTDSVYYIVDPEQKDWSDIESGDAIGSWSDDLNKIGTKPEDQKIIVETWAGSAKNYGYMTAKVTDRTKVDRKVKVKGFNLGGGWLNGTSAQNILSFDRCKQRVIDGFKDLVLLGRDRPSQAPQQLEATRFITAHTYDKLTVKAKQTYRFRYDKRQINPALSVLDPVSGEPVLIQTTPYGFRKYYDLRGEAVIDYSSLVAV